MWEVCWLRFATAARWRAERFHWRCLEGVEWAGPNDNAVLHMCPIKVSHFGQVRWAQRVPSEQIRDCSDRNTLNIPVKYIYLLCERL